MQDGPAYNFSLEYMVASLILCVQLCGIYRK